MHDLTLIGVHEDGEHLLLATASGERFRLPLDDALRAAARKDRPRLGQLQIEIDGGLRPREIQSLIRSGLSAAEVADRAGWSVEKVRKFEGPVLAEREYVANRARATSVARDGSARPTLAERANDRFRTRGVDVSGVEWDSHRHDLGHWVVSATFAAGGRQRTATWSFDVNGGSLRPENDDARWLGEDDQPGAIPSPHVAGSARGTDEVFDVTAPARGRPRALPRATPTLIPPVDGAASVSAEDELTSSIRAHHLTLRDRRGRRRSHPASTPGEAESPSEARPLVPLAFDLADVDPPPARPRAELPGTDEATTQAGPAPRSEPSPAQAAARPDAPPDASPDAPQTAPSAAPESAPTKATDEEQGTARRGRARVPAWDDVVFGTRPKATPTDDAG